jgi:pyruvate formate lyase activating enzyme
MKVKTKNNTGGGNFMREALLFDQLDQRSVRCNVCNLRCLIHDGKRGICRVRENHNGFLYALNYGKAIAIAVDPIEKKPLYHFLPGTKTYSFATMGCNMKCSWCQNWEISQSPQPGEPVSGAYITPEDHVKRAKSLNCPSISYTYSEPTIFLEYALETMIKAKESGLKNIWVTNGLMTRETLDLIIPYLDALNIDYKGPNDAFYMKYCNGKASMVMENMEYLMNKGIHMEITTLIIPGLNDQKEQLESIAQAIVTHLSPDIPWHISRFFPGWKMQDTPVTPISTLHMAYDIGTKAGIKQIHIGNV